MEFVYGIFFLLMLSISASSGVFAAAGGKKVTTMEEFNAMVCASLERKMKEGLSDSGVEKFISEYAQTIDVFSTIYSNLGRVKNKAG